MSYIIAALWEENDASKESCGINTMRCVVIFCWAHILNRTTLKAYLILLCLKYLFDGACAQHPVFHVIGGVRCM